MPKKNWREATLKREWITKAGALTGTKLSKLMSAMNEYDTESSMALDVIQSFGAFRDVQITVEDDVRSGERSDDVPIMRLVRIREFETRMMLQDLRIQQEDGLARNRVKDLNTLMKRHATITATIKEVSAQYKIDIRSLSKTEEEAMSVHADAVAAGLRNLQELKDNALALINELRKAQGKKGYDHRSYASSVMEAQATKWKERWLQTCKAVNSVISQHWASAEGAIRDQAATIGAPAAVANERWDLDYIGSLAKGVKGPPKQHIAFDPDKFDVDANLDAPSLSAWAITNGSTPDRDRLWGRKDPNLRRIASLQRFQETVHAALSQIPGYDADDPFELVVKADVEVEDEAYELVKSYIIELKHFTPTTLFGDFLNVDGVRGMLDDDYVPLPDYAEDLLGELTLYAIERQINLGQR